jgi:hypothetical protein
MICRCVDESGVSTFDTSGTSQPTALTKAISSCSSWSMLQKTPPPSLSAAMRSLPPCPCSGFQAMFTPGYAWLPNTDCFVTTSRAYTAAVVGT